MSTRYFRISNASKVVETDEFTFKFEKTYRFLSAVIGTIAIEDPVQADALAEVAAANGVEELTEQDYAIALQKKSSLNINIVKHGGAEPKPRVAHVEAKSDGGTSSDVESVDELLASPPLEEKPEPAPEPTPELAPKPKAKPKAKAKPRKSRAKKTS